MSIINTFLQSATIFFNSILTFLITHLLEVIILLVTAFAGVITVARTDLEDFSFLRENDKYPNFRFRLRNKSHVTPIVLRSRLYYRKEEDKDWKTISKKRFRAQEAWKSVAKGYKVDPHEVKSYAPFPQLPGTSRGFLPWRGEIPPRDFRVISSSPFPAHRQQARSVLKKIVEGIAEEEKVQNKYKQIKWDGRNLELHPDNNSSFKIEVDEFFPELEIPEDAIDLRLAIEQTLEIYRFSKNKDGEWYYLGKAKGKTPDDVFSDLLNVRMATLSLSPFSWLAFLYNLKYKLMKSLRILRQKVREESWGARGN
ncbi:hypothetical protein AKJ53_01115 [candidate division MSBL1 archaeon SCGC-AAA382F02]|uniref:Uncharacterized protein n=1 Tax=candidate division MSBL1 archaeon SCGC-AAA382F02 TaxID=1698282 RepID=A0A133VIB5_9EURY|nr:hypothetical protein AKJ53_01115 [candidate division MSBL1 archaeon SCGC-AAA382F02]